MNAGFHSRRFNSQLNTTFLAPPYPTCVTLRRMPWHSRFLLALAALIHLGLLVGWRWQMPLVPYFFDATVLSGLASGTKWQYNRLKYGESQADQPVSFD